MANIEIICRNFTGSYAVLNGSRRIDISQRAFLRAVITVGMQRFSDMARLGWRGFFYRFGIGMSALSYIEQRGNSLCLAAEYQHLDMSEKGVSSYWYGMALSKLVAETELSIPWLSHVDRMKGSGALQTSSDSNERGDLIGRGLNNDWHVLEAKGRSNKYSVDLVTKAKNQAARVISINGQPPSTTSACIAALFSEPISVLLDDPDWDKESNEQWEIKDKEFFQEYYRSIISYLREVKHRERHIDDLAFVSAPLYPFYREFFHMLPPLPNMPCRIDIELGLLTDIYKEPESAVNTVKSLFKSKADGKIGKDGIAIFGKLPEWEGEKYA